MKASLIYSLGHGWPYRSETVEIAKSGKWIDLDGYKPRIDSIHWGAADPALIAEAKAINGDLKVLDERIGALNSKLKATQPALLAQAAKVPMSPKVAVEPIQLTSDML